MIVLKKGNHYEHTDSREIAQAKVNDGFEVIKNSFGGPKIVKKAEPKKKMFSKKKQLFIQARSRFATTLEIRRRNGIKIPYIQHSGSD